MNHGWALLAILPIVLGGCVVDPAREIAPHDVPASLIVDFRLRDTSDGAEAREANPGPRCATAKWHTTGISVLEATMDEIGPARPVLVVIPVLEGGWATTGHATFAVSAPATIKTGIPGEGKNVGRIEWKGNTTHGSAQIDGERIPLPYYWKVVDEVDEWQVDAVIRMGPATVHTYESFYCE